MKIFEKKYRFLLDLNIDSFLFVNDALELQKEHSLTTEYLDHHQKDYRNLASVKKHPSCSHVPYIQMFDDKYGSIQNLSILDLIFMEGPNTISFLEKVAVTLE